MIRYSQAVIPLVISKNDFQKFNYRVAQKVITPILETHVFYLSEGIHGSDIYDDGRLEIKEGISPNGNGDFFYWYKKSVGDGLMDDSVIPSQRVWQTWIDKPVLENHDTNKVVGVILDAYPSEKRRAVDMLCAMEKEKNPKLAQQIISGDVYHTSMGVSVSKSFCSKCDKECYTEDDWCQHLRYMKGRKDQNGDIIFEINTQLIGLEDSIIYGGPDAVGADSNAKIREVYAGKNYGDVIDSVIKESFNEFCESTGLSTEEMIEYLMHLKE